MTNLKLPEDFETYPEARKNAFLKMKELKESGRRIVGVFCTYTPVSYTHLQLHLPDSFLHTSSSPCISPDRSGIYADLNRHLSGSVSR